MAHGVHGVMAFVTVEGPVPFLICQKLDLSHLTDGHIGRHFMPAGALGCRATVRTSDEELMAVQMYGVVRHRQIANANTHLVVQANIEAVNAWKYPAIPAPQVEVQHCHDLGGVAARIDVIGVE